MRVAYLDEAGTSMRDDEPYFVVAGIILAPDAQWNEVEAWMRALVVEYLGEEAFPAWGHHYNFHAKDIWHGSGDFPRKDWPLKKRMELFERISRVPAVFELPIVYSFMKKQELDSLRIKGRVSKNHISEHEHAAVFADAARSIDKWMIEKTDNEVIMLVAEDVDKKNKSMIEACHAIYVDRAMARLPGAFQAERIIEQVSFMKKNQSGILQLADFCSFIIKRRLQKCPKIVRYYNNMEGQIFHRRRSERNLATKVPTSSLRRIET